MDFVGNERKFSSEKILFFRPEFYTRTAHFSSKKISENEKARETRELIRSVTKTTEFQTFASKCFDSDEREIEKCELSNFLINSEGTDSLNSYRSLKNLTFQDRKASSYGRIVKLWPAVLY